MTVFVTSLRNALFTSVLAPYVRKKSGIFPPLFAYGLTDECFAFNLVAVKGNEDGSPEEDQTINLISMLDRSISSSLGCYLGIFLQLVPGPCFLYPYGHVPWHRVKLYGFTDPCHVPAPLLSYGTAQNPHTSPLIYQVAPFCPACHFGILVFPDLLLKDGAIYLSLDNIPLLTTLFIAPIVIRAKSLGAATICGGTVYYILQEWL